MLRGERLKLAANEPVDVAVGGPTQTNIIAVRPVDPKVTVYVRGDGDVARDTPDDQLGFPLPAAGLQNVELATNRAVYLVARKDCQVDLLIDGAD